ncbi:HNH endonuclease signature motif containing protein [Nocardioides marmoriginsengisoli]|nr:HNH endonuclease signature motif containing protein [Nocardioides marmoriginsengisoli]
MDHQDPDLSVHPVRVCAAVCTQALKDVADVPVEFLSAQDKAEALLEMAAVDDLMASLRCRLLAASDDVAAVDGARDAGAWLAHRALTDPGPRQADLRLGEAVRRWVRVGDAWAHGAVNRGQARVIADALDALPPGLDPEIVARAEEHLIALAGQFAPKQLRVLGRRILDVVAPEVGEAQEARELEAEESRARDVASLRFRPAGDGRTRIEAIVPDVVAHRLRTCLDAFTSPRQDAVPGAGREGSGGVERDRISPDRKRGQAFCALLEAIDPQRSPLHGGDATTVFVSVTLEALRSELAAADVIGADDERISASQARRLACTAKVVPVVLGARSEILDLGRSSRLFSPAQRKAMRLRDRRCRARGCTVPAPWCEAHHRHPWSAGGSTDLADGRLLCSFHHHRAHDSRYETTEEANGDVGFHRRT